jgi:hypothetical protein
MKKEMEKETKTVPKNVKVLGQSCSQTYLFLTVIDLENNEVVILCYYAWVKNVMLYKVIRTGSFFVNPGEQPAISGGDAPFEDE